MLAILTATYNRASRIKKLFDSLLKQNDKNFVWIIVDDGSTDDTEKTVKSFNSSSFEIRYLKKKNGGKASALNFAFRSCKDILFFIVVDSDDYLMDNAIQIIREKVIIYEKNKEVGAIFFRYVTADGELLKSKKKKVLDKEQILSRYEHDAVYGKYDGCIGYYKKVVDTYLYPEYKDEIYMGPIVLQMMMNEQYKIVFTNNIVGVAEYLPNGLTRSGRQLRLNNPLGMIHYCGLLQSKQNPSWISRIKYAINAQAYRIYNKISKNDLKKYDLKRYIKKWAYIPGLILEIYWKKRRSNKRGSC